MTIDFSNFAKKNSLVLLSSNETKSSVNTGVFGYCFGTKDTKYVEETATSKYKQKRDAISYLVDKVPQSDTVVTGMNLSELNISENDSSDDSLMSTF